MALPDRGSYLRNYVMGVLVSFSNKGLSYGNLAELADAVTEAVIEADLKWQDEYCCDQIRAISRPEDLEEDIPQ